MSVGRWMIVLTTLFSACGAPLEENVCQADGTGPGSHVYPQCRMSNEQLQMLLSQPTSTPYVFPTPER
jgi:hypothetical protein